MRMRVLFDELVEFVLSCHGFFLCKSARINN
jgi:hypothetical protein